MNVMVSVPEQFAARFESEARLERHVLEILALEEYRAGRMAKDKVGDVLGFVSDAEVSEFLRDHGVADRSSHRDAEADPADFDLVKRFKAFRTGKTLGDLRIEDLISEGRR